MSKLHDFGLVGLGVMGRNFILNVVDNGFTACGLDLDPEKVAALKEEGDEDKVTATTSGEEFVKSLKTPRKIMLLVPAGGPVDGVIESLLPFIDKGDLLIDGGNSFYTDTDRREKYLSEKGYHFIGTGVSGGAKGARFGPSIMPGGSEEAYEFVRPIFEAVSAKANGEPCVTYLGPKSAGNYVKMVHNGIEYGMMQLISEVYDLLKKACGLTNDELHEVFDNWNKGRLQSFLVDITTEIFLQKADDSDERLVDLILDKAKQKGTGKWTSQNAMDLGIAVPTIDAAVSLRELSAKKDERVAAEAVYGKPIVAPADKEAFIQKAEAALYFSFILSYAQGFTQLKAASDEYGYNLDMEAIARIWRGGCIIRAGLLEDIRTAFKKDEKLPHLLLDGGIAEQIKGSVGATREVVSFAVQNGVPAAALTASLSYFDVFTSGRLPLNLVQAQRDHFGAHTYERIDKDGIFHTEW
ncbi:NADP-dependent phosphogluconate dehydrogenase [Flammeovirgaceae bacterium SG7u.111]|nr:NADP-dependent phosphogluconate dehydrogenase [Flammeovirgaceae bacterium SG7u.132]WPO35942.1 NADP-dependent phosphogluconate dehydrogenase [Flammeovirgaceae bacterium SG7u.111]